MAKAKTKKKLPPANKRPTAPLIKSVDEKITTTPMPPAPPSGGPIPAPADGFPPELANVKFESRVEMPPPPGGADPESFKGNKIVNDEGGAEIRDKQASEAGVKPGVEPLLEKGHIVFEAPDGVLFAGPKDDIFKDPRNGRMIRPRRGASIKF